MAAPPPPPTPKPTPCKAAPANLRGRRNARSLIWAAPPSLPHKGRRGNRAQHSNWLREIKGSRCSILLPPLMHTPAAGHSLGPEVRRGHPSLPVVGREGVLQGSAEEEQRCVFTTGLRTSGCANNAALHARIHSDCGLQPFKATNCGLSSACPPLAV